MFELAQRTGFDIESLIFEFDTGAIGTALYNTLTRQQLAPIGAPERAAPSGDEGLAAVPDLRLVLLCGGSEPQQLHALHLLAKSYSPSRNPTVARAS